MSACCPASPERGALTLASMGTVLIGIVLRVRLFATPGHGCQGVSRRLQRCTVAGRLQMLTPLDVGWCTLVSLGPLLLIFS